MEVAAATAAVEVVGETGSFSYTTYVQRPAFSGSLTFWADISKKSLSCASIAVGDDCNHPGLTFGYAEHLARNYLYIYPIGQL
jgi:hypothetical protein